MQTIHTRMVAQIERVEGAVGKAQAGGSRTRRRAADDVGEPVGSGSRERTERSDGKSGSDEDDELDVPEFLPRR